MAFKRLDPVANGFYTEYNVTGAPTGWQAVSDNAHNSVTTPTLTAHPQTKRETYKFTEIPSDVPGITPVGRVEIFYEPFTVGGFPSVNVSVKALARLAGTNLTGPDMAPVTDAGPPPGIGPHGIKSHLFPTKPGGGAWQAADFQGGSRVEFGLEDATTGNAFTVPSDAKYWVEVEYQFIGPNFAAAQDVGSRIQRLRRRMVYMKDIDGPLWLLDAELLDDITVSYGLAEDAKGVGWLYKAWSRGWLTSVEAEVDRKTNIVTLHCFVRRDYACLWWDTMSSEATSGLYGLGVAKYGRGQVETFNRASGAWVGSGGNRKTRGGQYFLAVDGVKKVTDIGTIIFSTRTNKLFDSSYIRGTAPAATGHSFDGTGGGNTIECEAIPTGIAPLFVPEVGARRTKIVKGTAADLQDRNTTVVSVSANVTGWATFGHLDEDDTKPLKWWAKRVVGGVTSWWDQSAGGGAGAWGAGGGAKVWNPLTGDDAAVHRDDYKIAFGGSSGTIELGYGVDSAASNRTCYGYHQSWIEAAYLSDELIVTTDVAYTVLTDDLSDANNAGDAEGKRIFPADGFTWSCEAIPLWNPADLGAGEKRCILANEFDANNEILVYYDKTGACIKVDYRRAGGVTSLTKAFVPAKGVPFSVALRINTAAGEEDLAAGTMTLFVNRSPSSNTTITPITMTSTATVKRGHRGALLDVFDGYIRNWEVSPEVLADVEIEGKP